MNRFRITPMRLVYQIESLLVAFIILSCDSSTKSDTIPALEDIYQLGSEEAFHSFLINWQNKVNPIDENELRRLSDTLRSVYQIYQEFYNPFDFGKYCTTGRCPEFGNFYYSGLHFIIVQNKINFSLTGYEGRRTITDFRPRVNTDESCLFLTSDYRSEFDSFLNMTKHQNDLQDRLDFLDRKIKIIPGHWFGWHYITHPEVDMIYLNESLDSATVYFRIIYEGGEARFRKIAEQWLMTESKLTWIE